MYETAYQPEAAAELNALRAFDRMRVLDAIAKNLEDAPAVARGKKKRGPANHRRDSMRFVGVREAQAQLSGLVDQSQKERIVLTRHGQPMAVLTGVQGKDLEAELLAQDPEFRKLIEERRRSLGALVSHETLKAQAEQELARERRGARPRPRVGRGGRTAKR